MTCHEKDRFFFSEVLRKMIDFPVHEGCNKYLLKGGDFIDKCAKNDISINNFIL